MNFLQRLNDIRQMFEHIDYNDLFELLVRERPGKLHQVMNNVDTIEQSPVNVCVATQNISAAAKVKLSISSKAVIQGLSNAPSLCSIDIRSLLTR